jgi:hypothetical protein
MGDGRKRFGVADYPDGRKCCLAQDWPIPDIDLNAFPIATPAELQVMDWESRRWTVCQILREVYHCVEDPLLRLKLRIASNMTKEMAAKIIEHEPNWGRGRWPWRERKFETGG